MPKMASQMAPLGINLGLLWAIPPKSSQNGPKCSQNDPKRTQNGAKNDQRIAALGTTETLELTARSPSGATDTLELTARTPRVRQKRSKSLLELADRKKQ